MKFDYKTRDIFTGEPQRMPRKKTRKALDEFRDRQTVDLFLGDTDDESGRIVKPAPPPAPSVADMLGIPIVKNRKEL